MRRTTVYLDDESAERLARLARDEERSQAAVLRDAIATYRPRPIQDRNFALSGIGRGDGTSIADIPEQTLLEASATERPPRRGASDLVAVADVLR
jgi:predicted DNA-binding protein